LTSFSFVIGSPARIGAPQSVAHLAMPLAGVAAFVGGFGVPGWVLGWMIKSRQQKFLANLANAIDVVVRGIKTGLPLNECLGIIARESPEPIASEFREVVDQQRMGVTLSEALDRLVVRMPLPEVKFLAIVIAIQQSAGGNLSEALGNLSQVLRDRFSLKLKVKALSAEAMASAMVLGCLPPGVVAMLSVSSPDYLTPLYSTSTGNFVVLFSLIWMGMGIFIMKKMINFKY
jgi:tight adherence protein B